MTCFPFRKPSWRRSMHAMLILSTVVPLGQMGAASAATPCRPFGVSEWSSPPYYVTYNGPLRNLSSITIGGEGIYISIGVPTAVTTLSFRVASADKLAVTLYDRNDQPGRPLKIRLMSTSVAKAIRFKTADVSAMAITSGNADTTLTSACAAP